LYHIFFKQSNLRKGLDTQHPILKIGNFVFEGTYEDIVGTALCFEESVRKETDQQQNSNETPLAFRKKETEKVDLHYSCKTTKLLKMRRIMVVPKQLESQQKESTTS
jgi:hypothetical protein